MKLLVVDDDPNVLNLLCATLRADSYDVVTAADGDEAIVLAREHVPDVVLLDVMMPGVDGFEVCRRLRGCPELGEVSIYLLTALSDRSNRLKGFEAGADDFLSKPFDRLELKLRLKTEGRLSRFRRLLQQRSQFEELARLTPDGIAAMDVEGRVLFMNPRAHQLLGAVQGHEWWQAPFVTQDRVNLKAAWQRLRDNRPGPARIDSSIVRRDETVVPVELTFRRVADGPSPTFAMLLIRDLSEQARTRVRLEQSERLALIARASSGVAHDLVTYLLGIQRAVEGVVGDMPESSRQHEVLGQVMDSLVHAGELVHRMNQLGRPDNCESHPSKIELNAVIRQAETLLRHLADGARFELELGKTSLPILADPSEFCRALANLISNAAAVVGEDGEIRVRTFRRALTPYPSAATTEDWCFVQVSDNGSGIPEDVAPRIFEPYFTTKAALGGTGLGLPSVRDFVSRSGGTMRLETMPGRGTTFTLGFPSYPSHSVSDAAMAERRP